MLAPWGIVILEQCSLKETRRPANALQSRLECFSLTCEQLGIRSSPSPLPLHFSALTAAQKSKSHRNEGGGGRRDGGRDGPEGEGIKQKTGYCD